MFFFSIWVFFNEHPRFTGQQGKEKAISLTPLYHFHTLHRHLEISRVINAKKSSLHIGSIWIRSGTSSLGAQDASHYKYGKLNLLFTTSIYFFFASLEM